ncbi:TonB-dependent receptor [Sphingomonas sp. JC676]|uniref:TonB-dependent receptor n=1 Tax=Sphingomonas sp. JC676 TaxID=2768065 RepID=UPI001658523C|nr:TonB-dependent receptor [Sphingomonas sp. JC676]MBC9031821.1 TonB-dependent receptor [Sphingomonas sp. JC676]
MSLPLPRRRFLPRVSLLALATLLALPAYAAPNEDEDQDGSRKPAIVVTGERSRATIENSPSTSARIDAERIDTTTNAVNVEDTIKYLPSLVVRKRHIGDTQAPLATRTSGLGSSARSLIYADGALLSSLIGNNNTSASPRWGLVAPEEIERIDILYGPFSAAYAGNSIGAVVNITTRLPDKLEGTLSALTNLQDYDQYGTKALYPTYQFAGTLGDRFGPLSLFAAATHTASKGQPLSFVTTNRPAATGAGGSLTDGGYDALNRTGTPIRVLGASGIETQHQDVLKLKAALDVTGEIRVTYVGGLFLDDTNAVAETYLSNSAGPVYSGSLNIGGYPYNIAASAFSGGVYTRDSRHWSHTLSARGDTNGLDWEVIGSLYDFDRDVQRTPSGALPAANAGGAGQIVRLDGTGWRTLDAKANWRTGTQSISAGGHWDRFTLSSNRYTTTDWIQGAEAQLNLVSRGKTETFALWAQDAIDVGPVTLTLGGRYEWWRSFDGYNYSLSPALAVTQPERHAQGFSPKATVAWTPAENWSVRLSAGKAYRFPTVGELYQAVTTGPTMSVPDPTLRPEQAVSEELAIEHADRHGSVRLSLFNESVEDALISQSAPLVPGSATLYNYVQNVGRTRARGLEFALDRRDVVPRFDLAGSVTYTDAETREDAAFPAAVGKMLPSVPRWKASAVATWRPDDAVSLTAAARYASRNWGSLDNSDVVGNTWQGFYKYLVIDARAHFRVNEHYSFAVGVDNLTNDKYFLFHPFPQRSVTAEMTMRL